MNTELPSMDFRAQAEARLKSEMPAKDRVKLILDDGLVIAGLC
jgi:hypothetical protein